ncbi:hypothetical protein BEWA_003680 [Theileria equi strain WA]|uniref:Uncharacterized protein n=1 Tax=Theileria equi strain WA TaxID=1537102 RepID=L0AZH6_THEEQ|nr:hypothetical protein BEWA_003680 [Theileria equi strain WA]AFZ80960.1 hypothetical protein BEWA_003680 [Theileria equi strain WA]|eukprot:XP_004830626.1 hypothetical protein BEWA_003680 [Theileria equi strain WA]
MAIAVISIGMDFQCLFIVVKEPKIKYLTIDIFHQKISTAGKNKYCCEKHSETERRVTVTARKVANTIEYYKHEINDVKSVTAIYYKHNNNRKNITATTGLRFPLPNVKAVYAFYCTGNDPKLICIKEENPSINKWFKQRKSNTWEEVFGISNDPENIKSCKDNSEEFDRLVTVLQRFTGCENYKACAETSSSSSPEPGAGQAEPGKTASEGPSAGHGDRGEGADPASSPPGSVASEAGDSSDSESTDGTTSQAEAGKAERSTLLLLPASMAGKILSGVFGGSGAVGLAGYHLYKNSRDPWVRQI